MFLVNLRANSRDVVIIATSTLFQALAFASRSFSIFLRIFSAFARPVPTLTTGSAFTEVTRTSGAFSPSVFKFHHVSVKNISLCEKDHGQSMARCLVWVPH